MFKRVTMPKPVVLGHFKDVPTATIQIIVGKDKRACDVVIDNGFANEVFIRNIDPTYTTSQVRKYIEQHYAYKVNRAGGFVWEV